jgi:hypothetical protein
MSLGANMQVLASARTFCVGLSALCNETLPTMVYLMQINYFVGSLLVIANAEEMIPAGIESPPKNSSYELFSR